MFREIWTGIAKGIALGIVIVTILHILNNVL